MFFESMNNFSTGLHFSAGAGGKTGLCCLTFRQGSACRGPYSSLIDTDI